MIMYDTCTATQSMYIMIRIIKLLHGCCLRFRDNALGRARGPLAKPSFLGSRPRHRSNRPIRRSTTSVLLPQGERKYEQHAIECLQLLCLYVDIHPGQVFLGISRDDNCQLSMIHLCGCHVVGDPYAKPPFI